jgi:hypothetical protein
MPKEVARRKMMQRITCVDSDLGLMDERMREDRRDVRHGHFDALREIEIKWYSGWPPWWASVEGVVRRVFFGLSVDVKITFVDLSKPDIPRFILDMCSDGSVGSDYNL